MSSAHSTIGASSMSRWSKCPGSVRLSQGMPNKTSAYAAEGTMAHEVAERCLRGNFKPHTLIGATKTIEGHAIEVTEEMADAVQVYLDTIASYGKPVVKHIEHRFDLSSLHPGLFGTCDCVLYVGRDKRLVTIDLKYGAGIPVEVVGNPQLLYYSTGALLTLNYDVQLVEMVIVQPRCNHPDGPVRKHTISVVDMLDFKVDLLQYAKATEDPNAALHAGEHCRFCPAAPICPKLREQADRAASDAFAAPAPGTPYDAHALAEALALAETVEGWAKSVREFAYAEAEAGRAVPGYKLVEKRATRKWRDEAAAEVALKSAGLGETQLYPLPEIRSPAQIEKVLPKDKRGLLEELTVKESSGHVLVADSDKRPAVSRQSAADAFTDA